MQIYVGLDVSVASTSVCALGANAGRRLCGYGGLPYGIPERITARLAEGRLHRPQGHGRRRDSGGRRRGRARAG